MKKRLKTEQILAINKLILEEKSLNYIKKKTNLAKTTIYYHYRKIKGLTTKRIRNISENSENIGEFIGLFAGDGSFFKSKKYQYNIRLFFNKSEEEFVNKLNENLFLKLFHKKPMRYPRKNVIVISYYSKKVYQIIKTYLDWDSSSRKTHTVHLITNKHPKTFIIGFIRGLFDSDGHISNKKICFGTVSPKLCQNACKALEHLEMPYSLYKYQDKRKNRKLLYQIYIPRGSHKRFLDIIKPKNIKETVMRRPGLPVET